MKFAHLADCHIGSWREPKLRELNLKTFKKAVDICVKENVAFVLIAGDLFNTALPSIDLIKEVASSLERLRQNDISVYIIPGSHDFSPSGKTMLDVFEEAGLVENVFKHELKDDKLKLKFTVDKTNTKIVGLLGKKGSLEKEYYKILDKSNLEKETGFKIFMFHTTLDDFKPDFLEMIEGQSLATLPKNFNYYAGGHPHFIFDLKKEDYGVIAYPGALFPNNFSELEKFKHGGFYIVNVDKDKIDLNFVPIKLYDTISFNINVNNKTAEEAEKIILNEIKKDTKDKIVTLRISGVLSSGKISDIDFKEIVDRLEDAFVVLKNINNLTTREYEELKIESGNIDEIESKIITENIGKVEIKDLDGKKEEKLTHSLINALNLEKDEGEKNIDFEDKLTKNLIKIFDLDNIWK